MKARDVLIEQLFSSQDQSVINKIRIWLQENPDAEIITIKFCRDTVNTGQINRVEETAYILYTL
jgi:hypothetical protein